jgi:hypothetical protein
LQAAVPAMQEWWGQIMDLASQGRQPPPADGARGHGRHTEGRASSRRRDESTKKGSMAGVWDAWPQGEEGELGSRGMRARLAGAAAMLVSDGSEGGGDDDGSTSS